MSYEPYGGMPPHQGVDTSVEAAESMVDHVSGLRARVLRYVEICGRNGATVDEIEVALVMLHQTASARVRELVLLDEVSVTELRRRTRHGRRARVVILAGLEPLVQLPLEVPA